MFADQRLAARIEIAETRMCRALAEGADRARVPDLRVLDVGRAVAVYAGAGSPVNKLIGLGFDAELDLVALGQAEHWFATHHEPLQAEVSNVTDPELVHTLQERGYRLHAFENVLGLPLRAGDPPHLVQDEAIRIDAVEQDGLDRWLQVLIDGFGRPDDVPSAVEGPPVDALREAFNLFRQAPGFERYAARWHGDLAGGASFTMNDGIAQLSGATTLLPYRRRGIQTALLQRRLRDAADAGCELAVITTQPGSKSQQNAQRAGFALLYTRALLVRKV